MDDKHFSKNSLKLNGNGRGVSKEISSSVKSGIKLKFEENIKEVYKPISEETQIETVERNSTKKGNTKDIKVDKQSNGIMVQEGDSVNDGADEQMLGSNDNENLAEKRDEVKFIKGDQQNGDAKIDMGTVNTNAFSGMTKEELMKYANDPFWIRLRWICFILFWGVWVAMLIGAILIIINAPKCVAPEPLPWYKQGPLVQFKKFEADTSDLKIAKRAGATGVIYELPAIDTYSVKDSSVEEKIKALLTTYENVDINIILDVTPNYVTKDSNLMKNALNDETKRSAFIWMDTPEVPNNWVSMANGSAWSEVQKGQFVLSQFGDELYDLHMNDSIVQEELNEVLKHILHLGVKGIRFKNAKHFLLSKNVDDEMPNDDTKFIHTQYGFWTHTKTTFQEGLGDVLYQYLNVVKNFSLDAFLSVSEDTVRPEVFQTKTGEMGIDIPIYGRFTHSLVSPAGKNLYSDLQNTMRSVGSEAWLQWIHEENDKSPVESSASTLFLSLLPGVPVLPISLNLSQETIQHINHLRSSASYMHGNFDLYHSGNIVAYSRIKSGNPGYFVSFNPTNTMQVGNFTGLGLPDKMTVDIASANYNVTDITAKSKVQTDAVTLSPYSTVILTYVPVKSG